VSDWLVGVILGLMMVLFSFGISALIVASHVRRFHYPAGGQRQYDDDPPPCESAEV
jgi:hypothetical protein